MNASPQGTTRTNQTATSSSMKQPARRAARLLLLFVALASLHGCGSGEKTLGAGETIEAIFRVRWTAAMLDQAATLATPLLDLGTPFADNTLDDARAKLLADFGSCVTIDASPSDADATALHVTLLTADDAACEDTAAPCTGSYTLRLDRTGDAPALRLEAGDALECHDDAVTGAVTIRPLAVNDENPFPHLLELEGLHYRDSHEVGDSWEDYDAAEDFAGQFFVRATTVTTPSHPGATTNVDIPVYILAGTGSFHDATFGFDFIVEARNLGVESGTTTPRTGEARLEAAPSASHNFETRWIALTPTATTVTVERGKERWTGCISYGDPNECRALGY